MAKEDDEDQIIEHDEDLDDKDENDGDSKDKDEDVVEVVDEEDEKDERIAVQKPRDRTQETQEEKRARRRRERQGRQKRNYATRVELENKTRELEELKERMKGLEGIAQDFGKREASRDEMQLEQALSAQKSLYQTAEHQFNKAITEGNGAAAAEAQRIMLDANGKFSQLAALKSNYRPSAAVVEHEEKPKVDLQAVNLKNIYTQRFLAQNDWFDPAGGDEDSKLAKEIDDEVAKDGYQPHTKEYWTELNSRLKEELPHIYGEGKKTNGTKPRPKQVNGSMGADSASSPKPTIKIPANVMKEAQRQGWLDDPEMKKRFLRNWKEQQSGARN